MTSAQSRKGAPSYVEKSHGELALEPGFERATAWARELAATVVATV